MDDIVGIAAARLLPIPIPKTGPNPMRNTDTAFIICDISSDDPMGLYPVTRARSREGALGVLHRNAGCARDLATVEGHQEIKVIVSEAVGEARVTVGGGALYWASRMMRVPG